MDEQTVQQIAQQLGPQLINQTVKRVLDEIGPEELSAEDLMPLIAALEETLIDPSVYPQAVQAMYQAGVAEPGDLPEEFDPTFVVLMVIVLNKVAEVLQQQQTAMPANFSHGGLTSVARALQAQGRHGDTMLAHINPTEAAMLRRMGGSGTINPVTGLPEFFLKKIGKAVSGAVKSVVGAVKDVVQSLGPIAPIIAAVVAPYAIPALAGTLGVSTLAAGALYGAGTSALTGGNVIQGALMGGLGAGLGDVVGGAAGKFLGGNLTPSMTTLLGNTLVGGVAGAATGQGFGKGAIGGLTGTMLGNVVGNLAGQGTGTPFGQGLTAAGKTIGQMSAAGFPLKQAVTGGALSGLVSGTLAARSNTPLQQAGRVGANIDDQIARVEKLLADPSVPETAKQAYSDYMNKLQLSKSTMSGYQDTLANAPKTTVEYQRVSDLMTKPGTDAFDTTRGIYQDLGVAPPPQAALGPTKVGVNMPTATAAFSLAAPFALESLAKMQTPQQIQQAVRSSNPEYFEKLRLNSWDWNDISRRAAEANMPLGTYVASNWNNLTESVRYTSPGGTTPGTTAPATNPPVNQARGGALSKVAYLARGAGSGRDDTIDARLSDGEYVMDAETVAMLGDGSTAAGAKKLDQMRVKLRQHKGKNLAKGKFSANAKSPLGYLKGAA